jgi:hypothetical protein
MIAQSQQSTREVPTGGSLAAVPLAMLKAVMLGITMDRKVPSDLISVKSCLQMSRTAYLAGPHRAQRFCRLSSKRQVS